MMDRSVEQPGPAEFELPACDLAMREMLRKVFTSLVSEPAELQLQSLSLGDAVLFQVRCPLRDLPSLFGAKGSTSRAVRVIMNACAAKNGRSYSLDIAPHIDLEEAPRR